MNHLSRAIGFETCPLVKFKDRYYQPGWFGETMKDYLKGAGDGISTSD